MINNPTVMICAGLICVAAWLLKGSARSDRLRSAPAVGDQVRSKAVIIVAGVGILVILLVGVGGVLARWTAFIVAAGELAATIGWLIARQAIERKSVDNERLVIKSCGMIAGQLDAGEIPAQAMTIAAEDVPLLAPVAAIIQIGGDVSAELHALARQPGCSGFDWMARGWRLCERTGMPLSPVIRQLSDTLRQQGVVRDQRRAELASAKSTSRLLAGLPAIGIGMGLFVGADPLDFLTNSLPGHICLVSAASLICGGLIWTHHLAKEQ